MDGLIVKGFEPQIATATITNSYKIDSNYLTSGALGYKDAILNVNIEEVHDTIVLWDYYNGRVIFQFYNTADMTHKTISSGTLRVLYVKRG